MHIPTSRSNPKTKPIEARFRDSSAHPYLAFWALMLAGSEADHDGRKRLHAGR